jgi:hypothetical protein
MVGAPRRAEALGAEAAELGNLESRLSPLVRGQSFARFRSPSNAWIRYGGVTVKGVM